MSSNTIGPSISGKPTAIAPAPRRPRAAQEAGLAIADAAIAEPEQEKAERQEGRQSGDHQEWPDDPGPQRARQVSLHRALRIAERMHVEMRPQVSQAQQMERAFGPPIQSIVHDCR